MMVQNFMPFCYGKSLKFMEKIRKIHVFNAKQWTILYCTTGALGASKQVHCWAYRKTTKKDALLKIFKVFKEEAGGFPSLAQGKETDSRTCGITFDCLPMSGTGFVFL